MQRIAFIVAAVWAVSIMCAGAGYSGELKTIKLLDPQITGGKPLMQALKERSSSRSFSPQALSNQTISNLLWAASGINRPDTEKRTAPSAVNWQEIDIYVTTAKGLYLFDARNQSLKLLLSEDIRSATGSQDFVGNAPVNLVYVADFSRMGKAKKEDRERYSAADTGFISQNVYLYCASEGLATVVRGAIDRQKLAGIMKLRDDQSIILAQSVGYPEK
jgi:SagB-type dehydrogenase family enzyme